MNPDEMLARAETIYAIEKAKSEMLQKVAALAGESEAKLIWMFGWLSGVQAMASDARNLYADVMGKVDQAMRHEGKSEHDRDTRGNPL